MKQFIFLIAVIFLSNSFAQNATGYIPLSEEEYDDIPTPFMSSSNPSNLPKMYVISEDYFPKAGNQGNIGSCTTWATGYALGSFYNAVKNKTGKPNSADKIMSAAFIYHNIKSCQCGPDCGTVIAYALDLFRDRGLITMAELPFDMNCNNPSASVLQRSSNLRIKGYNKIVDKLNLNEYKKYLSNDVPIVTGTSLGTGFGSFYNKASTFTCSAVGTGGHAMLMVGYDDTRRAFKILNSWGESWGDKGYVWVDYDCFKIMMNNSSSQAYVISKDYEIPKSSDNIIKPDANKKSNYTANDFKPYGVYKELQKDDYFVTYGIQTTENIQQQIASVYYVFDDPSFYEKYVKSEVAPYYAVSYQGPYCLDAMSATVVFKDGTKISVPFDGCSILASTDVDADDLDEYVEIIPHVTAIPSKTQANSYLFSISLKGTELLSDQIEKVVYNYNHSSFKNPYVTVTNPQNSYMTSYNGWGCLKNLIATIYYTDGTTDEIEINMCNEIGW